MPREGRALNNFTQPTSWSRDEGKKAADALEQAFKVDSPCLLAQGVQRYEVPFAIAEAALACLGSTTYVPDFGGAAGNKSNIKLPPAKDCGSTNNEVLRLLWCFWPVRSRKWRTGGRSSNASVGLRTHFSCTRRRAPSSTATRFFGVYTATQFPKRRSKGS